MRNTLMNQGLRWAQQGSNLRPLGDLTITDSDRHMLSGLRVRPTITDSYRRHLTGFLGGKSAGDLARSAGQYLIFAALALIMGPAYAVIGYQLGNMIIYFGGTQFWFAAWMFGWLAAGVVALTVATMRATGIGCGRCGR